MRDDANFKRRMRELVDDGYLAFDKFGRVARDRERLTLPDGIRRPSREDKRVSRAHLRR